MTMAASTQGSWFSSGFHGHFRSKTRNDFVNEYRQQAKPSPPLKFVKRLSEKPTAHQFSNHDNRFSFLNTVTSFQDGLGKKKISGKQTGIFHPDFISWVPHAREIREAGPTVSSYRNDFKDSPKAPVQQILINSVRRPNTASPIVPQPPIDDRPITTYRFVHRHLQPNPKVNTNMNTGEIETNPVPYIKSNPYINTKIPSVYDRQRHPGLTKLRRSRAVSAPPLRESVAMCLQWYVPQSEKVTPLQLVGKENKQGPAEIQLTTSDTTPLMPAATTTAPPPIQHPSLQATPIVPPLQTAPSMTTYMPDTTGLAATSTMANTAPSTTTFMPNTTSFADTSGSLPNTQTVTVTAPAPDVCLAE
ncbi:uncharacterized protein LOC144438137 [Glandiceps talaboti]